ncbi:putative membrane protein [Leptolyngbyaceae cyanobacterium JSC-12]|nr:putative membrane protein [Leptolyngbyaceae cyanobacterium JSC-12]
MATPEPFIGLRRKDVSLAYVLLRILFGISFFMTGFGKIGGIGGFANAMVDMFKDTFLPPELVRITAAIIPPAEVIIGLLMLLGLFTRGALIGGFVVMMILHTGVTLLKNWDTAANQLIYCLIFFLLLAGVGFNTFSLDQFIARKRSSTDLEKDSTPGILGFVQKLWSRKRTRRRLAPSMNLRRS